MLFKHSLVRNSLFLLLILSASTLWAGGVSESEQSVSVYSHRHYDVDQRLYDEFTEQTGIQVNVVKAGADELIQRLEAEGEDTPADILITVDAGRLYRAKERNLLQPIRSEILEARIPDHLRDPENYWFGLTKRARIIAYAPERIAAGALSTYEDLTNAKWSNQVSVRSSNNIYNQSLLASIIAHLGESEARQWARGVVENFARSPKGNDRDQLKAIAAGIANIAVVNTYYIGIMTHSDNAEERRIAQSLNILFPNQQGRGTHINVSGAGVTKYAPHAENAVRLLEFLVSDEAQREFAAANYEYPVVPGIPVSETVESWGEFKEDELSLNRLGELNTAAVRIFDEVGWR